MDNQKPASAPAPLPRQLSMALDSEKLRGISPPERSIVVIRLARVLLEAAGVVSMPGAKRATRQLRIRAHSSTGWVAGAAIY
jgi:hypothetical protein